jgi:hypothetical protein
MLKKMILLASLALAAIAFAVPASASAQVWTGTHTDSLTGFIVFGNPAAGQTKFGCEMHVAFTVAGNTTTGSLETFEPTTATCVGEGSYTGCELVEHETTIPNDTTIHITGTNSVTLTTPTGTAIVIHNIYDEGCAIEKSTLTVTHLTLNTPTVAQGNTDSNLTDVTISGLALSHTWVRGLGEVTQEIATFGTIGTESHTVTIS